MSTEVAARTGLRGGKYIRKFDRSFGGASSGTAPSNAITGRIVTRPERTQCARMNNRVNAARKKPTTQSLVLRQACVFHPWFILTEKSM